MFATKKEYVKIRNLLKETGSDLKIEWLYVNRVVYAVGGFFATLILCWYLHSIAINEVLTSMTKEKVVFGTMNEKDTQAAQALTSYDTYMINSIMSDKKIVIKGKEYNIMRVVREGTKEEAVDVLSAAIRKFQNTTPEQVKINAEKIIKKATEMGGTTIRSYTSSLGVKGNYQTNLRVHTKEGEKCPVCNTTILKTRVGGRGTYYCPKCQK
jgi:hypothetical protein